VSQGLDRQLGWYDRLRLHLHLKICDACLNFKNQMAFLRKAMARLVDPSSKP
jgi:predicted anti-sigma-YlaC factor YlaD